MAGVGSIYTLHSKGSIIEGIGDEVLLGIISSLLLIAVVSIIYRNQVRIRNIHPLQEEQVQLTRDRLGLGQDDVQDDSEDVQTEQISSPPRPFSTERHCPVCLTDARYITMTSCGHEFCAPCIISYWRYGRWLGAVKCPVCRQKVSILFKNFSPEENNSTESEQWKREILEYNKRFSGLPRSLMDYLRDFPVLLRQLLSELFSVGGLVWVLRMRIILCFAAAALYFVSPLDIIPESVFGFLGLLDDLLIVLLLLVYVTEAYRQYVANTGTAE